jgi:hypothetical protein
VIKAKTSFVHGLVISLLSAGKALFMGYNRYAMDKVLDHGSD